MANVTLSISDALLRRARLLAVERGTSVNALIREYLESVVEPQQTRARQALLDLAATTTASSGANGRGWTRDELHER
ncbi:MAG TPA: hypothetical protein PKV27_01390 [Ilumatobacteraceae bacterium]|nr:hypothetical protein [Ilumatobacteraceae bacterium]